MADYQAIHDDVLSGTKSKDAVAKQPDATIASYYSWRSKMGHSKPAKPKPAKDQAPKVTTLELPGFSMGTGQLEIRGEPEVLANFFLLLGRKLGKGL